MSQSIIAKINRPSPDEESVAVTLTATVKKGEEIIEQKFTLNVDPWTHEEVLSNNYSMLSDDKIANGNENLDSIESNLLLPTKGEGGATIEWQSENTNFVTNSGEVIRPTYEQGNVTIKLTATITSGDVSNTKEFSVTILKKEQTTEGYLETLWASYQPQVLNSNADKEHITTDLYLPASEPGVSIVMTSNDAVHITNAGKVSRPISTDGNAQVTLTFVLSKSGISITRVLNCIVLALPQG